MSKPAPITLPAVLLAVACVPLLSARAAPQATCPGCSDQSIQAAPTYSTPHTHFSMGMTLTKYDGECFVLPEQGTCVMASPCTPYVEVWGWSTTGFSSATGSGQAGGVGLGSTTVGWGLAPWTTKTFYKDYIGIRCGDDMPFFYTATWTDALGLYPPETGSINTTLKCTACDD